MRQGGIGAIYALPSGANPTPIPIAIAKGAQLGFKQDKKPLRGQWTLPIDVLAGALDGSVKLTACDFRAATLQMVLAGATLTGSATKLAATETWAIPTTPFQVTVSNSANFSEDGGVLDTTAGKWLTRVAAGPTTGQYSVSAGVYTFAAADTGHNTQITYSYTSTLAGSQTLTYNNQLVGQSTAYIVRVWTNFLVGGVVKPLGYEFPAVHFSELSMAFKADDWTEQSLTGLIAQDTTSSLGFKHYTGE